MWRISAKWLLLLVCALTIVSSVFINQYLSAPRLTSDIEFQLKDGQTIHHFIRHLQDNDINIESLVVRIYSRLTRVDKSIQTGFYQFKAGDSIKQMIQKMVEGDVIEYKFTIIEGWTFDLLIAALQETETLQESTHLNDWETLRQELGSDALAAEGLFYPDTYYYHMGETQLDILKRAFLTLDNYLMDIWHQRSAACPFQTPYELLIAASLIEKETSIDAERGLIASVMVNRLRKKMRLQMDPSVRYGLSIPAKQLISTQQLRTDNQYNTYTRGGLPPTPIALVSAQSLQAAAQPDESEFLYFVADGKGAHQFSTTLQAHNRLKRALKRQRSYQQSWSMMKSKDWAACRVEEKPDILEVLSVMNRLGNGDEW